MPSNRGVLIIYTGGTIGSMPKDPEDEASPQVVVGWDEFLKRTPQLDRKILGFDLDFRQTSELLDSCNIGPSIWTEVAQIIGREHDNFEGFVILHGTDTMVYTASALSFMLANLKKPVVITGAQRAHLFQVRNDALQNMITAIQIANPQASKIPLIPEVMILFGNELLRGNRSRKRDANGYIAYESPKFPALANIGANIVVNEAIVRPISDQNFFVRKSLETNVIDFNVFPGIVDNKIAELLLDNKDYKPKGVVVRSYGAGNIPTDPGFLKRIDTAVKEYGVVFYNVTQCTAGRVELGLYETSNQLLSIGMVSGTDLTPEAALVKLMVALGDEDLNGDPVGLRNFLQQDQAGEQTTSLIEQPYIAKAAAVIASDPRYRFAPDRDLSGSWVAKDVEVATLRLYGATVAGLDKEHVGEDGKSAIDLELYANLSSNDAIPGTESPFFAGRARRAPTPKDEKTILAFDVSDAVRRLLKPGQRASFTIVLTSPSGRLAWERAELALSVKG